jgi:hypothetical protein
MYTAQGQLGDGQFRLVGKLEQGGADAIASASNPKQKGESLDRAAMETGAD